MLRLILLSVLTLRKGGERNTQETEGERGQDGVCVRERGREQ